MHGEHAVLADGNSLERIGLSAVLRSEGLEYAVFEVDRIDKLCGILDTQPPDLLVIDSLLDGLDGIGAVRRICERHPNMKVCVTVEEFSRSFAAQCMASGVAACFEKTASARVIFDAFRALSAGGIYFPEIYTSPPQDQAHGSGGDHSGEIDALTPRQRKVLQTMAQGNSNKEIARILGIREGTVKVHLSAVYRVLGVNNRVAALHALAQAKSEGTGGPEKTPMLPMPGLGPRLGIPVHDEPRRAG